MKYRINTKNTKNADRWPNTADIKQVNLISAGICNLNCKFCFLYKNDAYKEFNKEVRQAWQDGSYVENLKSLFDRLQSDPTEVISLELWGGETLLQISDITPNLKKLISYFPNVTEIRISTNWIINIKDFINFIIELDNVTVNKLDLRLQLSIDGLSGQPLETGHSGSPKVYRQNIKEFCDKFNNYRLRHVFVKFAINSNVKKDVFFSEFSTVEGIRHYIDEMAEFCRELQDLCISEHLMFDMPTVFPGYALPTLDTVQDGLNFDKILNFWHYVNTEYYSYSDEERDKYVCLTNNTSFLQGSTSLRGSIINDPNQECSELRNSRTILPDGTIVCCAGAFIYGKKYSDDFLKKEGKLDLAKQGELFKNLEYNPLTMSDEELDDVEWYISSGLKFNRRTHLNYDFAMAEELARCGQISRDYLLNKDLLLQHVIMLSQFNACHKENILLSNTYWLNSPGVNRRYLNGALQSELKNYILN